MDADWILVADESRARLFEEDMPGGPLREIADFANPEGRAMDRELVSDAQGRTYSKGKSEQPHSDAGEASPVEHATEKFARDLTRHLDQARMENRFRRMTLIAAPRFLGKLRSHSSKELNRLIDIEIDKDLSRFDPRGIAKQVAEARALRTLREKASDINQKTAY